jgi:hypothetical protein
MGNALIRRRCHRFEVRNSTDISLKANLEIEAALAIVKLLLSFDSDIRMTLNLVLSEFRN